MTIESEDIGRKVEAIKEQIRDLDIADAEGVALTAALEVSAISAMARGFTRAQWRAHMSRMVDGWLECYPELANACFKQETDKQH